MHFVIYVHSGIMYILMNVVGSGLDSHVYHQKNSLQQQKLMI